MSQFKLTISCDDINPKKGYRLLGEPAEKWFRSLNEEFGCKFNIFVPSCYHCEYPISKDKSWIQELASLSFTEICTHGHFHITSDPKLYGECEWAELRDSKQIQERISLMENEWAECGFDLSEMGHRNPGWLCSPESKYELQSKFKYVALHYQHNNNLEWQCKTFFGHDGIHQENISIHNHDMIMFQSHIAGKHNHNVWNEQNYAQLRTSLTYLFENYTVEPKFLKECLY
jgi:hypothetical protein